MSDAHSALITRFYEAFQRLDAEAMVACYSADIIFSDPAFGTLRGKDAGDMWRMLSTRAKDFSLTFDNVHADERNGSAHWVATYLFSQTGRTVVNDIQARFVFATARSASITTASICGAGRGRRWARQGCCWAGHRWSRARFASRH